MDKEIDIKKLANAAGYKGKQADQIAEALKGITHLSGLQNAYRNTPARIVGEDKWLLLQKLHEAAVAPPAPAPTPAPTPPAGKSE